MRSVLLKISHQYQAKLYSKYKSIITPPIHKQPLQIESLIFNRNVEREVFKQEQNITLYRLADIIIQTMYTGQYINKDKVSIEKSDKKLALAKKGVWLNLGVSIYWLKPDNPTKPVKFGRFGMILLVNWLVLVVFKLFWFIGWFWFLIF